MITLSNAQTMTTAGSAALTPPTSSHDNDYSWEEFPQQSEDLQYTQEIVTKPSLPQNGAPFAYPSPGIHSDHTGHTEGIPSDLTTPHHELDNRRRLRSEDVDARQVNGSLELYDSTPNVAVVDSNKRAAGDAQVGDLDDVSSKWIHRDKLARIENEELQAAGIILPRPRGRSKPRRDTSQDKPPAHRKPAPEGELLTEPRSQKNSTAYSDGKFVDTHFSGWDLRLPDEIAEESYFVTAYGGRGYSRIPVAKLSPAPIALEHIERDTPIARRRDSSPTVEESIAYPRMRARSASVRRDDEGNAETTGLPSRNMTRSVSDMSPKKALNALHSSSGTNSTPGLRKTSAQSKASSTSGRPKTRNGASKDSTSSGTGATRPSTRSGERDLSREISAGAASKQPEGEPPWMISAYRPDPRLPPDQQLLPTVARRLQQEKWEREGKFGNVYDRDFRPLTDEGYLSPPEPIDKTVASTVSADQLPEKQDEWPLKPEAKAFTSQPGRTGSYSTIPKIQEKPNTSPLPSPRGPLPPLANANSSPPSPHAQDANAEVKEGCGCCIVM